VYLEMSDARGIEGWESCSERFNGMYNNYRRKIKMEPPIRITERAARRLQTILTEKKKRGVRLFVKKGGCAGYEYGIDLEDGSRPGDLVYESSGITVFVDMLSSFRMKGSVLDFDATNLISGGFQIENPNVIATCACGASFRTEGSREFESRHAPEARVSRTKGGA
jgi:iron-sulfur cluster assembly protein